MADQVAHKPYWYDITIKRQGSMVTRSGTLWTTSPLEALNELDNMAWSRWSGTMTSGTICEVDKHGEIVATVNITEAVDVKSHDVTSEPRVEYRSRFSFSFPVLNLKEYEA